MQYTRGETSSRTDRARDQGARPAFSKSLTPSPFSRGFSFSFSLFSSRGGGSPSSFEGGGAAAVFGGRRATFAWRCARGAGPAEGAGAVAYAVGGGVKITPVLTGAGYGAA